MGRGQSATPDKNNPLGEMWGSKAYITTEQENTMFDLKERVKSRIEETTDNDIIVEYRISKIS